MFIYIDMHIYIHICTYICVNICVHMYVCVCVCVFAFIYIYVMIYVSEEKNFAADGLERLRTNIFKCIYLYVFKVCPYIDM